MRLVTILLLSLFATNAPLPGKEIKYPVSEIADSLKINAFSVLRYSDITVDILSNSHTRTEKIYAVTVLNENGKKDAWKYISFDSDIDVSTVDVKIYNPLGLVTEKWHKKDLKVIGYDPYGTAYSDIKKIVANPISNFYPYTVEYHIIYETNNTYNIWGWDPVWGENIAIEKSNFRLRFKDGLIPKLNEMNLEKYKVIKKAQKNEIEWSLENFKAIKDEPYMPPSKYFLPSIEIVLDEFTYEEYSGSTKSWKDFGYFFYELNKGKDDLPIKRTEEIDQIISNCNSIEEKVESLYKYMQSHTRYVNISVGIGGIRPFPASYVSENGYGDCKALCNYMLAILKHAGIKSYYTLVKAGAYSYDFNEDFVSDPFDHIILCVPVEQDTLWLECTSQTMPCGFLGDFTDNRPVLLITENGGVLAKTPTYSRAENNISKTANVVIDESGNCTAHLVSNYTGLEYDKKHGLTIEDEEQQRKMLYADFNIPIFKIIDFNLNTKGGPHPSLKEEINLELTKYVSKSSTRLFIPLNIASKWDNVPKKILSRQFDIHKNYTGCYNDTITFELPENYTLEVLPDPIRFETRFGKYESETIIEGKQLTYIRYLEINAGIFPANEYQNFRSFYDQVVNSDAIMALCKSDIN